MSERVALLAFISRHGTQKAAARAMKISTSYMNDLVQGRRACSPRILQRLGFQRAVVPTGKAAR